MTDFYIDANRGNDANSGLTKDLAWRTLTRLMTKLSTGTTAAGDNFLFESSSWFVLNNFLRIGSGFDTGSYINGTVGSRITFDKYDYSSAYSGKPRFQLEFTPVASDWVRDTTTVDGISVDMYYVDIPFSYTSYPRNSGSIPRVKVNDTLCEVTYHTYTGWHRGTIPVTDYQVMSNQLQGPSRIYIWTPTGVNPETYYGVGAIKYSPSSSDQAIFKFQNCGNYVSVRNLEAYKAGTLASLTSSSATADITGFTLEQCRALDVASLFATNTATTTATYNLKNIELLDNYIYDAAGHGMQIGNDFNGIHIARNIIDGAALAKTDGGGLYCSGTNTLSQTGLVIEDNTISRVRHNSIAGTYDGSAVYLEIRTNNAIIRRNTIKDCGLAIQDNSGGSNLIHSNFMDNCDRVFLQTGPGDYFATIGMQTTKFYNNTAINVGLNYVYPEMQAARLGAITLMDGTPAGTTFTTELKNNLIVGRIGGTGSTNSATGCMVVSSKYNTNIRYDNNAVYNFLNVKTDWNFANPTTPATTITANPLVRTDGAVSLGSPCIKAGIATGLTLTDNENNLFGITPTVGAFEFNAFRDIRWVFE